ncbi:MAG: dockerin type I repeat-containing protein [Planctomycetota bacterium]
MRIGRGVSTYLLLGLMLLPSVCFAQQSLTIGSTSVVGFQTADVEVTMETTAPTDGFVLAIGYDTQMLTVFDIQPSLVVAAAPTELFVGELFDSVGGCTLGVVLDASAPFMGQVLAPSPSRVVANVSVRADVLVGSQVNVPLQFVDQTFNSPTLSNLIVQGGQSLGAGDITLNDGVVSLLACGPDSARIEDVEIDVGEIGESRVLLDVCAGPVQGFVLAIQHDPGLVLQAITKGVASSGAEFFVPSLLNAQSGGTVAAIMDFDPPFLGQTIPQGSDLHIASFFYECVQHPQEDENLPNNGATEHALEFVDGVLGVPPLDNLIVVVGLSLPFLQSGGVATCLPSPVEDTCFACGTLDSEGNIVDVVGGPGDEVELCFFYKDSDESISAFQLGVCYDCELEFLSDTFNVDGTILDAVGAEFLTASADNIGPNCSFIAGILLDFLPPFDQQLAPPTSGGFLKMASVMVRIPDDPLLCNSCLDVSFCDEATGGGVVETHNLVTVFRDQTRGAATCVPSATDTCYACGTLDDNGDIVDIVGAPGETVSLCFFWQDPTDNISAFQIGLCFDCNLQFFPNTFSVDGTILDTSGIGAEFVQANVDNVGPDCSFVAGILLDFAPPFDGQTVPPATQFMKMACVDVRIADNDALCQQCLEIRYCDGVFGGGTIPTSNLVTVLREVPLGSGNFIPTDVQNFGMDPCQICVCGSFVPTDVQGFTTFPCSICIVSDPEFVRGNCNGDPEDKVTITDAATVLAHQFQGVPVPCLDACDANDDGKINLADAVYLLNYLFKLQAAPPYPFDGDPLAMPPIPADGVHDQGPDRTVDDPSGFHAELDCVDGRDPCATTP